MEVLKPTSTQIGAIAENLVVNALVLRSRGRFAPFSPFADGEGIDVLVYDKVTGSVIPLQVKARTVALKKRKSEDRGNIVHFEVREVAMRKNRRTYLLAVLLGQQATIIDTAWLIPLAKLEAIARKQGTKYVIRAKRSATSSDKFHPYFCESIQSLVDRLTKLFAGGA